MCSQNNRSRGPRCCRLVNQGQESLPGPGKGKTVKRNLITFLILLSGLAVSQPTIDTRGGAFPTINPSSSPTPIGPGGSVPAPAVNGEPSVLNVLVGQSKPTNGYYYGRAVDFPALVITVYSPNVGLAEGRRLAVVWTEPRTYRARLGNSYVWVYVN